jgi:hypothetical protein
MHTKDRLAAELRKIGFADTGDKAAVFFAMADKAAQGYYHDFLSPLDFPEMQLVNDLLRVGTPAALRLRIRVINGEFDASKEESDAWAASEEGQSELRRLIEPKPQQIGRLALRHEGNWWNAYYAMPDTMDGAILLGSIAMRFVEMQERKNAFMTLMREAVSDIIEEKTGTRPTWPEPRGQPAPESERSGHG